MNLRVVVLASGRGSNMVSLLDKIKDGLVDATVVKLISDREDADCLAKAKEAGVEAVEALPPAAGESRGDYDHRLIESIQAASPDLVVLAGFMRILSPAFCEAFDGKTINIHPALLPSFKGAHGIRDTLAAGARIAGCTTHFVTSELDGGPIILQAAMAIAPGEDEERLAARVLAVEHQLLPRTVQLVAEGRLSIVDGRVKIAPGVSWDDRLPPVPGVVYAAGY